MTREFTAQEKLAAAEREVKQRRYVYPRRVEAGKMSQSLMNEQIAVMEAIADDYRAASAKDLLL